MYDFRCQECGRVFRTAQAAQRAASSGCPKCGGVDVDVTPLEVQRDAERRHHRAAAEWQERVSEPGRAAYHRAVARGLEG